MMGPFPETFYLPTREMDIGEVKPGEVGEITMKVEVMSVDKEGVTVMKHGRVEVTKPFGEMSLEELRSRIGTTEEHELPMNQEENQ